MKLMFERVLVVEAHPDDGTVSAGGTIARIKRENPDCEIRLVYFCPCNEDPANKGNLLEHERACEILGIEEIIPYAYPRDKYLENNKQEIRDILWKLRELYQPDLVLCPSPTFDLHQDHKTVGECCDCIFRDSASILHFEVIRSTPKFSPNFYVILNDEDFEKKMEAIDCYKSQKIGRPYFFSKEIFKSNMVMRGTQIKAKYAEAFDAFVRV